MFLAGHCPTKEFTRAEWESMPVFDPKIDGDFPEHEGYSKSTDDRGVTVAIYWNWDHYRMGHAVRPVLIDG